jgi:hypothetical protein
MTMTFTDEARASLDRYLRQVRAVLSGQLSVDVSDVERDILSHIDAELFEAPQPVSAQDLRVVLDRLGAPERWLPVDETSPRGADPAVGRAEDSRLAIATFGLFALGIVFFMRMIWWPLPPLILVTSFVVGRAAAAGITERSPETRRWLVYLPLGAMYLLVAAGMAVWPLPLVAGGTMDDPAVAARLGASFGGEARLAGLAVAVGALGVWWAVLGLVLHRAERGVRWLFMPFADWFGRAHARRVAIAGVLLAAGSAAMLVWLSRF